MIPAGTYAVHLFDNQNGSGGNTIASAAFFLDVIDPNTPLGGSKTNPIPNTPIGVGPDGTTPTTAAGNVIENHGGDVQEEDGRKKLVDQNDDGDPNREDVYVEYGDDIATDVTGAYLVSATFDLGVSSPIYIGGNVADGSGGNLLAAAISTEVAKAYRYWAFGLSFASVLLPDPLNGIDTFGIRFGSGPGYLTNTSVLTAGTPFDFTAYDPNGFRAFELFGFESLGYDPFAPAPFVLGLTFVEPGIGAISEAVTRTSAAAVPEPSSLLLLALGSVGLCRAHLRRRFGRKERQETLPR